MPVSNSYMEYVIEQLSHNSPILTKRMFGGVGIYADGLFFAVIANDQLYFKVDDTNRQDYIEAGMEPFRPFDGDRPMKYWEVPVQVLEDLDQLKVWQDKSIVVAQHAKKGKKKK